MWEDRRAWDPTGGKDNIHVHTDVRALIFDSAHIFRYYLEDCKALVFVVDSSDHARMPEARKALKKILVEDKLANVPLMVLANKKDLPNCMTIREVNLKAFVFILVKMFLDFYTLPFLLCSSNEMLVECHTCSKWASIGFQVRRKQGFCKNPCLYQISSELGLDSYNDRLWEIQACSGLKGLGLLQAFNSINKLIKRSWDVEELQGPGGRIDREQRLRPWKAVCILN